MAFCLFTTFENQDVFLGGKVEINKQWKVE
jgi:hypothetical protein